MLESFDNYVLLGLGEKRFAQDSSSECHQRKGVFYSRNKFQLYVASVGIADNISVIPDEGPLLDTSNLIVSFR